MFDITHRIMSHHSATNSPLQLLQPLIYNDDDSGDINHINKKKVYIRPSQRKPTNAKKIDREKSPTRTEPDEVGGYSGRSVLYINQQRTHPHQRNPSF